MEDTFYSLILKNGAKCLAMNANMETDPDANDHTMLSAEDVMGFYALKQSNEELVSKS